MEFACACMQSVDGQIAEALPFVFYWGVLFAAWLLISIPVRALGALQGAEAHPIGTLRYLCATLGIGVFTLGLLPALVVLLPLFVLNAGRVLGQGLGSTRYRQTLRLVLLAGVGLVPAAYLRVGFTIGLGYAEGPLAPMVCLGALVALFGCGYRVGSARAQRRRARTPLRWTPSPRRVSVQRQQGCPLCWEQLSEDRTRELAVCWCCNTVTHAECLSEMGRCPTLGCASVGKRSGRRRRPAEPAPALEGLCVQARAGEVVLACS